MKRLVIILALVLGLGSAFAPVAYAATNPFDNPNNPESVCKKPNAAQSPACQTNANDPISGPNGVLINVSRVVAVVAGIAAIITIIIGGIMFVTAGGDSAKVSKARLAILGAVIGLVIIIAAQAIITFVVTRVL